ncbi:MAG: 2,3-bisphosphoglycerate-independent phosphoglycerate mutase [Verrucomicrobiota bacterium]
MKKPVALIIRDGWGIAPGASLNGLNEQYTLERAKKEGNAPLLAKLPFHDHLYATYPISTLSASGEDVGLPKGQMGNSEVGHLNIGAGRIVYQDLTRINLAIRDGSFFKNETLLNLFAKLKQNKKTLHLVGLISDGGVHSHQEQALAMIQMAKDNGLSEILLHAITDGRDTSPTGGVEYIKTVQEGLKKIGAGKIATMVGRYYAMDRDKRWQRTQLAYELFVNGVGEFFDDPVVALEISYKAGVTDEFVKPVCFIKEPRPIIRDGDGILFFNFRADRARQLSRAWLEPDFKDFDKGKHIPVEYVTLTQYDVKYDALGVKIAYPPQSMKNILAEIVANNGMKQFRLAETEKYPHVTYFFNGGNETPHEGEDREMIPSPKVATYDLQPEMSAYGVTDKMIEKLDTGMYDLLILNFANPDMVGHTGILEAAIQAVETVDVCLKRVVEKILSMGGCCLITADHGNCESMITAEGTPQTAHTSNLVHLIYAGNDHKKIKLHNGILADLAPTLLDLLHLPVPREMTGKSLFFRE